VLADGQTISELAGRNPVSSLFHADPWRTFRWYEGQRHYSGKYWSVTEGDHVIYESRLELSHLLMADFNLTVHRKHSDKELDDVASNLNRAILAFEKAFNVGRFTIVEAECYEAMGIAYNAFVRIKDRLSDVETMAQTPANIRRVVGELTKSVRELNTHVADLVRAGQRRVSPMQTWRNKRRRREVRTRLEEKYFKLSTESGQT
jgi:hypothetical protein